MNLGEYFNSFKMFKIFGFTFLIFLNLALVLGFRYSDAENTLKAIRERASLFDEGSSSAMLLSDCNYDRGDLKRIILSATRAMDFFERYLNDLVLDAAIGTRLMESQLMLFQAGHPKLPQTLQMYLMTLQFKSELLSEEIIDKFTDLLLTRKLAQAERNQLQLTLNWVYNASLWESPGVGSWNAQQDLPLAITNQTVETLDENSEVMTEETSDACIGAIFHDCTVSDACGKLFMEKPHTMYSLTHQILFFLIAKKQNCFTQEKFESKTANNTGPAEFMGILCDKVWDEANMIENSGYPVKYRDLLAEQITVCGLAGYSRFFKHSWLENILSWQNQEDLVGCFVDRRLAELPKETTERIMALLDEIKQTRRIKRSDNFVRLGDMECSVHFTSVCLGALAMHLRYFGDTCLRNY